MNILGRDGNISIIRVGTIAAILGLIFVAGGVVLFFLDRASHQVPLEVEPYPGATLWSEVPRSKASRSVYYQVTGATAEEVAQYYQGKMNELNGGGGETCVRVPSVGNFAEYDRGDPNVAPYQFSCMFDRSGFQITQYTRVNIQPGIASTNTQGMIVVEYEQYWQP